MELSINVREVIWKRYPTVLTEVLKSVHVEIETDVPSFTVKTDESSEISNPKWNTRYKFTAADDGTTIFYFKLFAHSKDDIFICGNTRLNSWTIMNTDPDNLEIKLYYYGLEIASIFAKYEMLFTDLSQSVSGKPMQEVNNEIQQITTPKTHVTFIEPEFSDKSYEITDTNTPDTNENTSNDNQPKIIERDIDIENLSSDIEEPEKPPLVFEGSINSITNMENKGIFAIIKSTLCDIKSESKKQNGTNFTHDFSIDVDKDYKKDSIQIFVYQHDSSSLISSTSKQLNDVKYEIRYNECWPLDNNSNLFISYWVHEKIEPLLADDDKDEESVDFSQPFVWEKPDFKDEKLIELDGKKLSFDDEEEIVKPREKSKYIVDSSDDDEKIHRSPVSKRKMWSDDDSNGKEENKNTKKSKFLANFDDDEILELPKHKRQKLPSKKKKKDEYIDMPMFFDDKKSLMNINNSEKVEEKQTKKAKTHKINNTSSPKLSNASSSSRFGRYVDNVSSGDEYTSSPKKVKKSFESDSRESRIRKVSRQYN